MRLILALLMSTQVLALNEPFPAMSALKRENLHQVRPERQQASEDKVIAGLKALSISSNEVEDAVQEIAKTIQREFQYSARVTSSALDVLRGLRITDRHLQDIVSASRFQYVAMLDQQRERKATSAHQITVWNYASDAEVNAVIAKFDQLVCSYVPKSGLKTWDVGFVARKPGPGLVTDARRLACRL